MIIPYTDEQLKKMDEIMGADWKAGIIFDKIKADPQYPFSQLDCLQVDERISKEVPISDLIIHSKSALEVNVCLLIIVILSVLLFHFAFLV